MTDQPDEHAPSPADEPDAAFPEESLPEHSFDGDVLDEDAPAAPVESTGHPAVDEVLRSLEGLDGRPVDEHVAAFEQAHEVLRRALSHAGDDPVTRPED
jgi:hypothetical protein